MTDRPSQSHIPYEIVNPDAASRWLITCDHATNIVPDFVAGGDLGLPAEDMARHIAYDIGAAGVTRALAAQLGCTAILSRFSRLVIDPNRGEDDPTLLMQLYDGTIIPANRDITADAVETRLNRLYRPYHDALAELAARRDDTVIVSVHSFTPQLRGRAPRPWHIGVLHAADTRLSLALLERLRDAGAGDDPLCVGRNEPYGGHLPGDAISRHALPQGRHNTLIELRNDLITTPQAQAGWAARLAPILRAALQDADPAGA